VGVGWEVVRLVLEWCKRCLDFGDTWFEKER
jgi:hypothetical protein